MNDYIIITDSCCDLSPALAQQADIQVMPMGFVQGESEYQHYIDARELSIKEFYKNLREGSPVTTTAINPDTFTSVFEKYLSAGTDVLYLAFSSGLSSTAGSAAIVAGELAEKYPDRKIFTVDTLCASMGEGLLVYLAALKRKSGQTIEEVRDFAEQNRLNLCHWFTVDDLNHLKRGGRVSAATALVGTVLGIKPVLHVDDEGHLINVGKARGRKASIMALLEQMKNTAINPKEQTVFISHGDCEEDAQYLANEVDKALHPAKIHINPIGPVIGAHSGPGTLALFFLGSHR